jgi:ribosomal-protein-alanine N-acetyltransferase
MESVKDEIIYCNQCGAPITSQAYPKKDYLQVSKSWGYFSQKDLQIHEFCLCESCYDAMVRQFKIPPKVSVNSEAV